MGWAIGNCMDTLEEQSQAKQSELFQEVQQNKINPASFAKFMDQQEALRLTTETTRNHHNHDKIDSLLNKMIQMSQKLKDDPNALQDKMGKLKDLNQKLSQDLQGRIKGLESSKGIQIFLAVFALGLTAILGFGCYYCFLAGGKDKGKRDEELLKKMNEYQEKMDKLMALEKDIKAEKAKLKSSGLSVKGGEKMAEVVEAGVSESEEEEETGVRGREEEVKGERGAEEKEGDKKEK